MEREHLSETPKYKVMSYEEYAKREHDVPYVYEIVIGEKKITYFGADHSMDPRDPMFDQIARKFKETSPQIVFVEGISVLAVRKEHMLGKLKVADQDAVIAHMGEAGDTAGDGVHLVVGRNFVFDDY